LNGENGHAEEQFHAVIFSATLRLRQRRFRGLKANSFELAKSAVRCLENRRENTLSDFYRQRHLQESIPAVTAADNPTADDRPLLRAWSRGRDEAAFTQFVQRHLGMVQGAALRKTARVDLSEDVAQAVFALAARRAAALAEHPCPAAWLHRTAVLESANALRRELKHRKLAAAMLIQPDTSRDSALPHAALPHLDDALNTLPEHDRRAVLLRFGEKLSYDQMAARLGKSADACQKQTSRALDRLRSVLSRKVAGVTATALAAGLVSALHTPASAAAVKVSAAAIAAAPKISLAAIASHILHTMSTGKQIAAATGLVALLASVPLGYSYSEADALRTQLEARSAGTPAPAMAAADFSPRTRTLEPPGSRVIPGMSNTEAERTIAMLRGLRGKLLTSAQMAEVCGQIMSLPETHLPKALESMSAFTGLLPAGVLRAMVFARWGELAPESGIAALDAAKLDMFTGEFARYALAGGWMERDPQGLAAWLKSNPKAPLAGVLGTVVALDVKHFDRATMQQLYDVVPNGNFPGVLELEFESQQEDGDVAAVAARLLAKAPDDHRRDQLLASAAGHIAEGDPRAALEFVVAHPDPRGQLSQMAMDAAAGEWARRDFTGALQWAYGWQGPKHFTDQVWKEAGRQTEEEILRITSTAPDAAMRDYSLQHIALESAARDPEKALRLLSLLPDEPRHAGYERYGAIRAGESVVRTSEWLVDLPASPDKDAAIAGFAPVLAKSEPDAAVIWAASIQDGTARSELVRQLGSAWLGKSPDAARAWMEQSEHLTAADRAAILATP
jgi:RNA polymerase sigma-70 factor (ECF subfamily)